MSWCWTHQSVWWSGLMKRSGGSQQTHCNFEKWAPENVVEHPFKASRGRWSWSRPTLDERWVYTLGRSPVLHRTEPHSQIIEYEMGQVNWLKPQVRGSAGLCECVTVEVHTQFVKNRCFRLKFGPNTNKKHLYVTSWEWDFTINFLQSRQPEKQVIKTF